MSLEPHAGSLILEPHATVPAAVTRVKGTKIQAVLSFARERCGESTLAEITGSLTEREQRRLASLLVVGWYPSDLYGRLVDGLVRIGGAGHPAVLDHLGERMADYLLLGSNRSVCRSGSPEAVLSTMVPIHRSLNDPGKMVLANMGAGHLRIEVYDPPSSPRDRRIARSFYRRAVELSGAEAVRVDEPTCSALAGDACRFDVWWKIGLA